MNKNITQSKGHFMTAMSRLFRKKIAVVCIAILIIIYFMCVYTPKTFMQNNKPKIIQKHGKNYNIIKKT